MYSPLTNVQPGPGLFLVDTHCHLDCEPLRSGLPAVLEAARRAGVVGCIVPGVQPAGWDGMAELARRHGGVFPAFGIHPMHAALADGVALERLERLAVTGVALGEMGLDPTCPVPLERQERALRDQLRLAVALNLPVLVHCRKLFERTRAILKEERADRVGGIMHAFSGSPEMAREFIRLGFLISLAGSVTWPGAVRPGRLAARIPLESLVLETDAPDLAPHPHRGQPNQPAWLVQVLAAVAGIRGLPVPDLARAVQGNTRRLFPKIYPP